MRVVDIFSKIEQVKALNTCSNPQRRRHGGDRKHGRNGFLIRSASRSVEFGQSLFLRRKDL